MNGCKNSMFNSLVSSSQVGVIVGLAQRVGTWIYGIYHHETGLAISA